MTTDDELPIDINPEAIRREVLLDAAKVYLQTLNVKTAVVSEETMPGYWLDVTVSVRRSPEPESR